MACPAFTFQSGYIPINTSSDNRLERNGFTFQSGYIPIEFNNPQGSGQPTLHSNLVIFQLSPLTITVAPCCLYIPIWLYSNPSTIIPHIYRLWKLLFVDLRFLIHPTAIFFASYSYYLCLDPYYNGFVYLPIFKVYHRLTIILVQLMFYINLV